MSRTDPADSQLLNMFTSKTSQATVTDTGSTDSTLYPKITTHVDEVIATLRQLNRDPEQPGLEVVLHPIPIIGTVKLHGTHADIVIHSDHTITFQSRNLTNLSTAKDNQGFAAAMSQNTQALSQLKDLYLSRWRELSPTSALDESLPVIIAGEWIGEKIQKGVAIAQLSRRFVIVSININSRWQRDQDYSGISLPNHDIYNASRAGVFNATLYPEDIQRTVTEVERLAEEVAARCPFAATFDRHGEGEGLVWKLAPRQYNSNPALWFKTKGGKFKPTFFRPPKKTTNIDTVEEKRKAAAAVAEIWCSEQRMEQGWDVLREKGVERDMKGLGEFLKWVQQDILVEEQAYIKRHEVDKPQLNIEIGRLGRVWYLARLERSGS
jgi:hypothetical protein